MNKPEIITSTLPGPLAAGIVARDAVVMSPSYTRPYPFVIDRGQGVWVLDVDGNRFLDFNAGIAVCSTGHSHPKVTQAIREQTKRFLHYSGTDFYYEVEVRLAERLAAVSPTAQPAKVFFCNSGAEAIEAAIKLARYSTKRQYLLSFHGGFHGRTMGALSLTCSKTVQRRGFGPFVPGVLHAPYGDCFHCPLHGAGGHCELACLDIIAGKIFGRGVDPDEVAAVVVEPIQGEGGYIIPQPGFLAGLREICDRHGILLVVDEVQSGMGRTGRMFAIEHEGVRPDIVALAKGIASGLPLGAIIASADLMRWPPGSHGSTFGGNPVACAAALATLDLLEGGLIDNAANMGKLLLSRLRRLARSHAEIGEVRGRGLMCAVEFVLDARNHRPNPVLRDAVVQACFRRGLLVLAAGAAAIRICPPLVVRRGEVETAVAILDAAIGECSEASVASTRSVS